MASRRSPTPGTGSSDDEGGFQLYRGTSNFADTHGFSPAAGGSDSDSDSDDIEPISRRAATQPVLHGVGRSGRRTVTLADIEPWDVYAARLFPFVVDRVSKIAQRYRCPVYPANAALNKVVSVYRGDSTNLEIDAIVNAANSSLLGGGGSTPCIRSRCGFHFDGAIHAAAGPGLYRECLKLGGCPTGQTKITGGHRLPCKHILHTVGPVGENPRALQSCYQTCLDLALQHNLRSVGFCCVSTGIYGYPVVAATRVALATVRAWLEQHPGTMDRVIFVCFLAKDFDVYNDMMQAYFPLADGAQPLLSTGTDVAAAAAAAGGGGSAAATATPSAGSAPASPAP